METLHRSQNLIISRLNDSTEVNVEIRFSTSIAKGLFDSKCPRCGESGTPEQWEFEGPESSHNTIWLKCNAGCLDRETRWTRRAEFDDSWTEVG